MMLWSPEWSACNSHLVGRDDVEVVGSKEFEIFLLGLLKKGFFEGSMSNIEIKNRPRNAR